MLAAELAGGGIHHALHEPCPGALESAAALRLRGGASLACIEKGKILERSGAMIDLWYKNAVIYSLDVDAFCDGNGDGIGDFRGLTSKLD